MGWVNDFRSASIECSNLFSAMFNQSAAAGRDWWYDFNELCGGAAAAGISPETMFANESDTTRRRGLYRDDLAGKLVFFTRYKLIKARKEYAATANLKFQKQFPVAQLTNFGHYVHSRSSSFRLLIISFFVFIDYWYRKALRYWFVVSLVAAGAKIKSLANAVGIAATWVDDFYVSVIGALIGLAVGLAIRKLLDSID